MGSLELSFGLENEVWKTYSTMKGNYQLNSGGVSMRNNWTPMLQGLAAVLRGVTLDPKVFEQLPSSIAAGFDSVVQLSTRLINRTLRSNRFGRNLNSLSARVAIFGRTGPPSLNALIQPLMEPKKPRLLAAVHTSMFKYEIPVYGD